MNRLTSYLLTTILLLSGLLFQTGSAAATSASQVTTAAPTGVFYVSPFNTGGTQDGLSWATAWSSFSSINWNAVPAGSIVYLDGGPSGATYAGTLIPKSDVTVRLSVESGHGGQAILFGGRSLALPYCDQANYVLPAATAIGIDMSSRSNVVIDGVKWNGIVIHGYNLFGIKTTTASSNITVKYVEIKDNGKAVLQPSGKYRPDQPGVFIAGSNIVYDHALVHNNGQDAFQSSGVISNITIQNSWLYNDRVHPSNPSLAFNFCMHSDGIQVYNGGVQSGVTINKVILGPGLMQGTLLGQSQSGSNYAVINNVTMTDVLALDNTNANIMGYDAIVEQNWHIDHVTLFHVLYDPDAGQHHQLLLRGTGHSFNNSIIYGGGCYVPDGISTTGDYRFNTTCTFGTNADPQFVAAPAYNSQPTIQDLMNGNYGLQPGSPATGKGSRLTKVSDLWVISAPQK